MLRRFISVSKDELSASTDLSSLRSICRFSHGNRVEQRCFFHHYSHFCLFVIDQLTKFTRTNLSMVLFSEIFASVNFSMIIGHKFEARQTKTKHQSRVKICVEAKCLWLWKRVNGRSEEYVNDDNWKDLRIVDDSLFHHLFSHLCILTICYWLRNSSMVSTRFSVNTVVYWWWMGEFSSKDKLDESETKQ